MTVPTASCRRPVAECPAVTTLATVLAVGIAVIALAGCYVSVGAVQHRTNRYSVTGHVQTLSVTAHVGDVQITGANSGTISVTEHLTFRSVAPATTHRSVAGTLSLNSTCPSGNTCSVSYDIKVPEVMTVRVTDNVGTISLASLSGDVVAQANAGKIDLDSVSGTIEASADAGTIGGQNLSPQRVTLRVSAGDIDATFSAPPLIITATTSVGAVTLRVPGNMPYNVAASTTVGDVRVGVTRSPTASHVIIASARTGSVTIEPTS